MIILIRFFVLGMGGIFLYHSVIVFTTYHSPATIHAYHIEALVSSLVGLCLMVASLLPKQTEATK